MKIIISIVRTVLFKFLSIPKRKTSSLHLGHEAKISNRLEINAGHLSIGDYSYIGGPGRISSLPNSKIKIGKFVSIAAGINIVGALHKNLIANYPLVKIFHNENINWGNAHGITKGDIVIGNDVWIGTNVIILTGVEIGNGAIIGAGAVVTKNVPPYAISVGVPAKVIKYRYEQKEIEDLNKIAWWDWDIKKIKKNLSLFVEEDIKVSKFLKSKYL